MKGGAALCLGVDGGGTQTVALLARRDEAGGWSVLGRGVAGPSNPQAVGPAAATRALDQAISLAFASAGIPRGSVAAACLGLAGADRPQDQRLIQEWASQVGLAEIVEVTSDAVLVLAAGTPAGWGLGVIAGTGSIAVGRSADGRTARAGGWGYLLGDEGSGYGLVMAGLQAVVRAADGRGPATLLTERLLSKLGVDRPEMLVPAIYRGSWDRAALAGLAPLVLEAAAEDAVAAQIREDAARALAEAAAAVARKLELGPGPVPVSLAGGVLLGDVRYRERVLEAMKACGIQPDPVHLVREPAEGAVRMAVCRQLATEK
ncbi:MAG TPA: BadF/BadG/BcrA/BcrD ATPase family protein [Gemmataceae bacterium]|nr:BadF/BadG/BcrA/BcrD ATPase family protein [Gemmataceae bacterium]